VFGPLKCHPYRLRERKKECRLEELKKELPHSCLDDDDGVEIDKKTENDARDIELATEERQTLCTPIESSRQAFEKRLGPDTAVPLFEQARVFAAMEGDEETPCDSA